ncbi:MAG: hypothetical protein AAGF93_00190 [Cyanobacteria bacterium P01_H01_bin.105]
MARWDNWNPPTIERPVAKMEWATEYAALVHEGAEGGGMIYPGRPWTDYAIAQTDFERVFTAAFSTTQNLQVAFQSMVDAFESACRDAMSAPVWYWPVTTLRYNGEVIPPGARDIRDLDELYRSLTIEYQEGFTHE